MNNDTITIEADHISKDFRVYHDKSHTFKDRILFRGRNRYEAHHVLKDVSFRVGRGEALGLIGHNGCGKSTTLKLLNRILYPDSGTITMKGRVSSLIELGAGFHPDMTGRENIYINATIFGLKKKEIDDRLEDIIRFSELEEFIDNPVRTYSSGMYMRLAFAIAINVDADILLVDEILAVGDANFQKKCFDRLAQIKKEGTTIVIVSHSMEQILSICDRVIWIDRGEIKEEGEASRVCKDYLVIMNDKAEERKRAEHRQQGLEDPEDPNVAFPVQDTCPQYGIYTRRSGNMKARFTHVELQDEKGEPCLEFTGDGILKVQFAAQSFEPEEKGEAGEQEEEKQYDIIFNLFHQNGTLCSTFSTHLGRGGYLKKEQLGEGTFVIRRLSLAEGDYILDAILADEKHEAYDCLGHLVEFHVSSPRHQGTGIAAMPNEWTGISG